MIRKLYLQLHYMWHNETYFGECGSFACPRCKKSLAYVAQQFEGDSDMIIIRVGKTNREITNTLKKEQEDLA